MIYSSNSIQLPGAATADDPSCAAELPENGFVEQFDTVNPLDLQYQVDLDSWIYGNVTPDPSPAQDRAVFQESAFPYHPYPGGKAELTTDAQHHVDSEQDPDALCKLKAVQDTAYSLVINSDIEHTQSVEEVVDAQEEKSRTHGPYKDVDLGEYPQGADLDQLYRQMENSNEEILDHIYGLSFNLDFGSTVFGQTVDTEKHFKEPPDESKIFGPANNTPYYDYRGIQYGILYPALAWTDSAKDIERPRLVQGSFPQVSHISDHTLLDITQLRNSKLLVPSKREKEKRPKRLPYKRRANIESLDPKKYYKRLPAAPRSWSPNSGNSMVSFQYNEYGNLCTSDKFSPNQILEYLYCHPLNYSGNNVYDPKNGRLTLWIQTVPADAVKRYPDKKSDKCRFSDCPVQGGSIRKGFFRVAFDEYAGSGRLVDPYHCAGFVHLFCLEKFCDFPEICRNLNVRPDERRFDEGKNKMAVTRDHPEMAEVVRKFIESSEKKDHWNYEQTLGFQLTSKHLELECPTRRNKRIERGGNHIELHKGDLDKFIAGEIQKRKKRQADPKPEKPFKRRRVNPEEEEEDIDDLEDEVTHKLHSVKNMRFR